jgi:hypothetical protein
VQPDVKFGISSIYNGAWTTWSNISNHSSKVAWIIEVYNVSIYQIERKKKAEYNNEHVIDFTLYPLVLLDWKSGTPYHNFQWYIFIKEQKHCSAYNNNTELLTD